jgi:hypothetical protein
MARGHREGRAPRKAGRDGRPSAPLASESTQMIALVHASQRLANRAVASALDLFARLHEMIVEVRENRRKLEADLFHNRYHISSKNDDDVPIVR